MRRQAGQTDGTFTLREQEEAYSDVFSTENDPLSLDNRVFGTKATAEQLYSLVRPGTPNELVRPGALSAPLSPFMRYAASANFFCSRFPINAWASALVNPTSGGRTAVQAGSLRK